MASACPTPPGSASAWPRGSPRHPLTLACIPSMTGTGRRTTQCDAVPSSGSPAQRWSARSSTGLPRPSPPADTEALASALTGHAADTAAPEAASDIRTLAAEEQAGSPVRSQYSKPGAPRSQIPQAIIVAPATYNTINKWALGISDTHALGVLAEVTGLGIPIVVLPFVNTALASRPPFQRSVESLRAEGVRILLGPGGFEPHPPRTGGDRIASYPWHLALDEADRLVTVDTVQR